MWSSLGGTLGFPAARKCNANQPALKQSPWSLKSPSSVQTVASRATSTFTGDVGNSSGVVLVAPGGGCLTVKGAGYPGGAGGLVIAPCNVSDPSQIFESSELDNKTMLKQRSSGHCVDVHANGPIVWMCVSSC